MRGQAGNGVSRVALAAGAGPDRRQSPGSLLRGPADTVGAPADTDSSAWGQGLPARKPGIIFGCTWDGLSEKRTAESLSAHTLHGMLAESRTPGPAWPCGSRSERGTATVPPDSGDIAKLRSEEAICSRLLRQQLNAASQACPMAIHR